MGYGDLSRAKWPSRRIGESILTKIPVAILGATGAVGQQLVARLQDHPLFEIAELRASEKSVGQPYSSATTWRCRQSLLPKIAALEVTSSRPSSRIRWVFSALGASAARDLELQYRRAGCIVLSASSAHRLDDEIPLVAAQVNVDHLQLCQTQFAKYSGVLAVKPNCVVTGLAIALKPLQAFGICEVLVQSLQSISGAGYPGVAAWDLLDNLLPLPEEEEKVEIESLKVLGSLKNGQITPADIKLSARCVRVPVLEGHFLAISARFVDRPTREEIVQRWRDCERVYSMKSEEGGPRALRYLDSPLRPQPRLDRDAGNGMTATVGSLRECNVLNWKFSVLTHNTIQGAAGGLVLLAESMQRQSGALMRESQLRQSI